MTRTYPENNIKISIITVSFNAAKTIEDTIKSVMSQTYANLEYIIVDGASTDNTVSILEKYKSGISKFVSEVDNGIYDAMNKGLDLATGDWLYFIGADDVLASPTIIEEVASIMTNPNFAYYGNVIFKTKGEVYNFRLSKWSLCLRNISHQSIFYPFKYYKNFKYDPRYRTYADHIYNIKLYAADPTQIMHIDKVIAIYNDQGASSSTWDANYFSELPKVVCKYLGFQYAIYVWARFSLFRTKRLIVK